MVKQVNCDKTSGLSKLKSFISFDINTNALLGHSPQNTALQSQYIFYLSIYLYIKVTVCTYVPFSRPNRRTNLHQILHRFPHQLGEGS